jgi:hypothetical protein
MKKKKESESYYEEQYRRLLADNNSMNVFVNVLAVIAFIGIVSTLLLARSGDELTRKVRINAYYEKRQAEYNNLKAACIQLPVRAIFVDGQCAVETSAGGTVLNNLEEIKQAKLHFELGEAKK